MERGDGARGAWTGFCWSAYCFLTRMSYRPYKRSRGTSRVTQQGRGSRRGISPTPRCAHLPPTFVPTNPIDVAYTAVQRIAHGALRRPARRTRHDPAVHGRRLLLHRHGLGQDPQQHRRGFQAAIPRGRENHRDPGPHGREDPAAGEGHVGRCVRLLRVYTGA